MTAATIAHRFWAAPQRALFAERYWDKVDDRHRAVLMEAVASIGELGSALEVGCNAGPNLRLLHARSPQTILAGIDIHPDVLAFGEARAQAEGWRWRGVPGAMQEVLPTLKGESLDLVFSCYALAYLPPEDVGPVLYHMLRVARKAVVLAEPMVLGPLAREGLISTHMGECRHDYLRVLRAIGLTRFSYRIWPVVPPVDRLNGVLRLTETAAGGSAG